MSTITATTATVASVTGATNTRALSRSVNPDNADEVIIAYGSIGIVVNRRAWTLLSINAPVKDFVSIH